MARTHTILHSGINSRLQLAVVQGSSPGMEYEIFSPNISNMTSSPCSRPQASGAVPTVLFTRCLLHFKRRIISIIARSPDRENAITHIGCCCFFSLSKRNHAVLNKCHGDAHPNQMAIELNVKQIYYVQTKPCMTQPREKQKQSRMSVSRMHTFRPKYINCINPILIAFIYTTNLLQSFRWWPENRPIN